MHSSTPAGAGALTAADFQPQEGDDKRREERVTHRRVIQLLPEFLQEEWRFVEGELIDCSPHGLAVYVPAPMKIGADFMVKLRLDRVVLLLYSVRYCREEDGRYRVGAQFTGLASDPVRRDPRTVLEALLSTHTDPDPRQE